MKLQTFLIVGMIIELCLVPLLDAKRSFGITRSRNKNKGPSVRRNQHGTYDDNPVPPAVHPKPSAPEIKKPVPYSSLPQGPPPAYPGMSHHSSAPYGAPPAYPGMSHHSAAPYGAPPAYSPSYGSPPGYSSYSNPHLGYNNQPRFNQQGWQQGSFNQPGNGMSMGGVGGMAMGGSMMGAGNNGYGRSSGFGSGIMTNLFAGLAGYQLAKAFSGGNHRDRETIIIDNRQLPVQPPNTDPMAASINTPEFQQNVNVPTEIPQTPVNPAVNEYNFYGIPQYGIPLYGYSLPSQITDYYSTAVVALPPNQPAHD